MPLLAVILLIDVASFLKMKSAEGGQFGFNHMVYQLNIEPEKMAELAKEKKDEQPAKTAKNKAKRERKKQRKAEAKNGGGAPKLVNTEKKGWTQKEIAKKTFFCKNRASKEEAEDHPKGHPEEGAEKAEEEAEAGK